MRLLILFLVAFVINLSSGQTPDDYFHPASKFFIDAKEGEAKRVLEEGLRKFPNDPKLKALRDQIKEEEKKKEEQQNKENQDQKDKQNQEKKQDQQKKEQQKKEQEEKEKQNQKEKKDPNFNPDKLKDIKVSEEKAKMILEAMKNQEKQYLQQNKRKTEKPKDKGKPDW